MIYVSNNIIPSGDFRQGATGNTKLFLIQIKLLIMGKKPRRRYAVTLGERV